MFDISRPQIPVSGGTQAFPVRRVYCVGRNYAAHARESGGNPDREAPFYFMKPADAIMQNGSKIPYPPRTRNLHHEIELVVAIGEGGCDIAVDDAERHIFGYSVGLDLTRRDLQTEARNAGKPWDTSKGFDHSAPVTDIHTVEQVGHPSRGRIWLEVNGTVRQDGDLAELIWSVPEAIAELSTLFALAAGDLIFTGTPAGVGPLLPGDRVRGGVDGVDEIRIEIVA